MDHGALNEFSRAAVEYVSMFYEDCIHDHVASECML